MAWTFEQSTVDFCPSCGSELTTPRTADDDRLYCQGCGVTLYRNPVPLARATVVEDDAVLLIRMGEGRDRGSWALPGGHIEPGESPRDGAARELQEETGLTVPAAELRLVGDGFLDFTDGHSMVSFNYAARRELATGTLEAQDDAATARFWSREELRSERPLVRASGVAQLLDAMAELTE